MRDEVRHGLPEYRVDEEDRADDDQREADGPAGGFEQEHEAEAAEDGLDRNAVPDEQHPLAGDQTVPAEQQVERREPGEQCAGDVVERQTLCAPTARERKDQKAQQQREGEVDAPSRNVADDGEVQHEGERRSDPELVDGPREAEPADQPGQPRSRLSALVFDLPKSPVGLRGGAHRA